MTTECQTQHMLHRFPVVPEKINTGAIQSRLSTDAPGILLSLLGEACETSYAAQEIIYQQGDRSDTVYFIGDGLLKLMAHLPNGRIRIVRLHRAGSIIGMNGLLGQNNAHTAISITPLTALHVPVTMLQCLRADAPDAYVWLVEHWHDYLKQSDIWITQFSTGPIRSRVACLLNFLCEFEAQTGADDQLQLLTCEEMSSILGVTAESVSRTLAEFKRAHILDEDGANDMYRADKRRLREIAAQ